MRFHLLGLAHLPTNKIYESCAYTQKILRLSDMLMSMGNEVIFYGCENSEVKCTEFVQVLSEEKRVEVYGDYDWKNMFFKHDPTDEAHNVFNVNSILEITKRRQPKDILLITMGNYQKPISDALDMPVSECGIGYTGVFTDKRVFESYAWMHHVYGLRNETVGNFWDAVIPNSYYLDEFIFNDQKEDYYLFIGRLIKHKGIQIAIDAVRELGKRLVVAGQGDLSNCGLNLDGVDIEHIGTVTGDEKKRLYANAIATFVPTMYIGPFEGVSVESMLSGTPVITTDFGVFTETVVNGLNGYRCRIHKEFVKAADDCAVGCINHMACRNYALSRFSTEIVKHQYHEYYERLHTLFKDGWYQK